MMSISLTSYVYQYYQHLLSLNHDLDKDRWKFTISLHLYFLFSIKWILLYISCNTLIFISRKFNFFDVYMTFLSNTIESSCLSSMTVLIRAILDRSVKIWNMLIHSVLVWSLKSWYRAVVYLFGIRLYATYDIILLNWSDFRRKRDQYHRTLRKDDDLKKRIECYRNEI